MRLDLSSLAGRHGPVESRQALRRTLRETALLTARLLLLLLLLRHPVLVEGQPHAGRERRALASRPERRELLLLLLLLAGRRREGRVCRRRESGVEDGGVGEERMRVRILSLLVTLMLLLLGRGSLSGGNEREQVLLCDSRRRA